MTSTDIDRQPCAICTPAHRQPHHRLIMIKCKCEQRRNVILNSKIFCGSREKGQNNEPPTCLKTNIISMRFSVLGLFSTSLVVEWVVVYENYYVEKGLWLSIISPFSNQDVLHTHARSFLFCFFLHVRGVCVMTMCVCFSTCLHF